MVQVLGIESEKDAGIILKACRKLQEEIDWQLPITKPLGEKDSNILPEEAHLLSGHMLSGRDQQLPNKAGEYNEERVPSLVENECQLFREDQVEVVDLTSSPEKLSATGSHQGGC